MISTYFEAEKRSAFIFLALGLISSSIASGFFISAKPPFYMGLALPFIAVGIYEIIVGIRLARDSDFQALELKRLSETDPEAFQREESQRLEKLMLRIRNAKIIAGILFLTGFFLMIFHKTEDFWQGLGCSLELQGALVQMFYFFAERRARKYADYVHDLALEKP